MWSGSLLMRKRRVVDASMVESTQGKCVGKVSLAPGCPRMPMVKFAPGVRSLAAIGGTVAVPEPERGAVSFGEEASRPPEIEHLGLPPQNGGDETRLTRQPASRGGRNGVARVHAGSTQLSCELLLVKRDEDGRAHLAVDPVAG